MSPEEVLRAVYLSVSSVFGYVEDLEQASPPVLGGMNLLAFGRGNEAVVQDGISQLPAELSSRLNVGGIDISAVEIRYECQFWSGATTLNDITGWIIDRWNESTEGVPDGRSQSAMNQESGIGGRDDGGEGGNGTGEVGDGGDGGDGDGGGDSGDEAEGGGGDDTWSYEYNMA